MNKIFYRLSFILGSILIIIGLLFKIQHWPGSKISLLIGYGFIGLLFTPIYFGYKLKTHSTKHLKRLDLIGIICLISLSTGSILNILDFKFGYYIALFGFVILVFLFIPLLTFIVIKNKENRFKRIFILSFSVIYVLWSFYWIFDVITFKSEIAQEFAKVDQGINLLDSGNNQDYDNLLAQHKDSNKIFKLKLESDSIKHFIQEIKIEIISNISDDDSNNDSIINDILFNKKMATALKFRIDNYRNFILSNFDDLIDKDLINKYLSTKIINSDSSKTWEDENFNHLPFIAVTTILSKIESDIYNVEKEIIRNLKK